MKETFEFKSNIAAGVMNWGSWGVNFTIKEIEQYIAEIVEAGISVFDHADIYGDYEEEARFGSAFRQMSIDRTSIQLISKCGIRLLSEKHPEDYIKHYNTTKEHIISSAEKSLKNLQTEYLDLLLIHRPSHLLDPEEVAKAFTELKDSGKVLHFGVSNFSPSQFDLLNSYYPLVTNQVEASILHLNPFQDGTFDQALKHKIRPMIWSPFAGGKLFSNDENEKIARIISLVNELSLTTNYPFDQLLLAFLLKHPCNPIPVLGTTKIKRIISGLKALNIEISDKEWFEMWTSAIGGDVA